jgi:hypothetical protein
LLDHLNQKLQNLHCKCLFFSSLPVSRSEVHDIRYRHLKLLLAAALIGVFTLNGVSPIQLVALIAFSAGVYSARFLKQNMEHDRETERPLPTSRR